MGRLTVFLLGVRVISGRGGEAERTVMIGA